MEQLLERAYQVTDFADFGGPKVVRFQEMILKAKVEGSHTKEELLQMPLRLLAERLTPSLPYENRELSVY